MLEIRNCTEREEWNSRVLGFKNFNVFSTYEWGNYKSLGWQPLRLLFFKNISCVGASQLFVKKIGPFKLIWGSSGILFTDVSNLSAIVEAISVHFDLKKTYIRFNFFDPAEFDTIFEFDRIKKLLNVKKTINSGYTIRFYQLKYHSGAKAYSSNNRYYLKKANGNALEFQKLDSVDVEKFVGLHNEMTSNKHLEEIKISSNDIQNLVAQFGHHISMFSIKNGDRYLSSCLVLRFGNKAYYYLAASSEEGRKENASFAMIDYLINHWREEELVEFDFGGITPFKDIAAGVNRFKGGFGGSIVKYVGERVLCDSKILRILFDFIISKKLG